MRKSLLIITLLLGVFFLSGCNTFLVGTGGDYARLDQVPKPAADDVVQLVSDIDVQPGTTFVDWDGVIIDFNGYKGTVTGCGDGLIFRQSDYNRIQKPRLVGQNCHPPEWGYGIAFQYGSDWNQIKGGEIQGFNQSAIGGVPGRYNGKPNSSFGPIAVLGIDNNNRAYHHHMNQDDQFPTGPSIISFYQPRNAIDPAPSWWLTPYCKFIVQDVNGSHIKDGIAQTDGNVVIFDDWNHTQDSVMPPATDNGCVKNVSGWNLANSGETLRVYETPSNLISSENIVG